MLLPLAVTRDVAFGDLRNGGGYSRQYYRYTWHGDVSALINATSGAGDGWNVDGAFGDNYGANPNTQQFYAWGGAWGYLNFNSILDGMNAVKSTDLYYVHGRWYNPETGLFISPDGKGEYLYGSGDDAVNWAWIADQSISLGNTSPLGRTIVLGGGGFVRDTAWANYQIFYPPAEWTLLDRLGNTTRGVAPIFLAEGIVTLGPQAVSAGATYLGRTLLGRAITGGATACAADQSGCANALETTNRALVPAGRVIMLRPGEFVNRVFDSRWVPGATNVSGPFGQSFFPGSGFLTTALQNMQARGLNIFFPNNAGRVIVYRVNGEIPAILRTSQFGTAPEILIDKRYFELLEEFRRFPITP